MRFRTLGLYLIGNRQAILDLAADPRCLWVGLLLVFSAGLAREYDGQDLLREPWHLLIPVGASLVASFLLFLVACGRLFFRKEGRPPFFTAYRTFLTLFWMTAPLAWLYAIPYERFLSAGYATRANLWTLALVAAWRVALMVRVVSVITGRSVVPALMLVMTFADAAALAAVYMIPKPIVPIMGGVRLTDSENAVVGGTLLVACLGIFSAPIWGIGGLIAFFTEKPAWQVPANPAGPASASRGLWVLAACSLLIWLPILPWTQAEQHLRSQVERDMKAGRIADALELMSAHAQSDFPPQWEPPPRVGYHETSPKLFDVMDVLVSREYAPWVRASYVDKLRRYIGNDYALYNAQSYELPTLVRILERLPEGPAIAAEHRNEAESLLSNSRVTGADRENLEVWLKLAEKAEPPGQ
jgi:hypothetical protein